MSCIGDVLTPLSHENLSVQNAVLSWLPNVEKETPIICRYFKHLKLCNSRVLLRDFWWWPNVQ